MTDLQKYRLSIYERCERGNITKEEKEVLLESSDELMEESVNPLKKYKKKIEEFKKKKPTSYSDNKDVEKFVDETSDLIDEASKLLEKEPEEFKKIEITQLITAALSWITLFVGLSVSAFIPFEGIIILVSMGSFALSVVIPPIILYSRSTTDTKVLNDLIKIRSALKKINLKKLPKEYRKKIEDIITAIDDAEEEFVRRTKTTEESVDEYKLSLYERCEAGEISEEERDVLLEAIDK